MPRATSSTNVIATIGIDIGKNTFHVIGLDDKGAIILRHKLSRGQVYARLANIPPCLIGMEACVGAHHLGRQLSALGHDARLMPARYVRPYSKGQKNDFRDAEAIAEAVQRPTMKFVAIKTVEQLDLQGLHRIRERLVCQRTSVINQIRAFLLERGIAVRQGLRTLRTEMPIVLSKTDKSQPRPPDGRSQPQPPDGRLSQPQPPERSPQYWAEADLHVAKPAKPTSATASARLRNSFVFSNITERSPNKPVSTRGSSGKTTLPH